MDEITIELDDETAEWLEATAAERQQTTSEFIAELLRETRYTVTSADPRD
jgi:hypothetical protein